MFQKTQEQILKKWKPVLDALKVTNEEQSIFMGNYGEYLLMFDDYDIYQNLLPMSMKVLSMINFEGKNVVLKKELPTKLYNIKLDDESIEIIGDMYTRKDDVFFEGSWEEYEKNSKDKEYIDQLKKQTKLVKKLEDDLITELINDINKELETKNNFYIDNLMIKIVLENKTLSLYTRYNVE